MNSVLFLPEVHRYFKDLIPVLYEKGYFSYLDASQKYVQDLIDDIMANLPTMLHKPAPKYFDKYGKEMKYAGFRKNKNTMWYIFFKIYKEKEEIFYLVRYIGNNHTISQYM
jgi:hypothetical protein